MFGLQLIKTQMMIFFSAKNLLTILVYGYRLVLVYTPIRSTPYAAVFVILWSDHEKTLNSSNKDYDTCGQNVKQKPIIRPQ